MPFQGYRLADPEWQVEVSPGHTMTVNGTVQAVIDQLEKRDHAPRAAAARAATAATDMVAKRATDFSGGSYICGHRWPYAPLQPFWEGLRYLRSLHGQVHVPPGPRMCSQVSCSYSAAVWICNDNTKDLYLDSFSRIADGVSYIIGLCATNAWGPTQVAGQVFHPDHWNIIVRHDKCL
ncbi:hypothetical protein L209DRAFT_763908 [Thermothelomyces heterothallicus CBS 203.75]